MPKKTFFKLSEKKQTELIRLAEGIFLEHTYTIPLLELAEKMGLATSTFYRYFKDKDDLFLYWLDVTLDNREPGHRFIHAPRHEDLSTVTEYQRRRGVILNGVPEEIVRRFYFGKNKERLSSRYKKELQRLKYDGELREDADPDLLAFMYATSLYNFEMYCRESGINDDIELKWKIKKYFYYSFFKFGIMKDSDSPVVPE